MGRIDQTTGTGIPPRSFEDEFLTHPGDNEWWCCTGFLTDEEERQYAFQFTIASIRILGVPFHLLLTSLTDLESGRHFYGQQPAFLGHGITATAKETTFGDRAHVEYRPNERSSMGDMRLGIRDSNFELKLHMSATKPPVWHCDNGVLQMGIANDPRQVTYYYSFTHLLAAGLLDLDGQRRRVHGQVWFDRQGGPFTPTNVRTNWEWFSLRFFDDSELMLFSFPQTGLRDGTSIAPGGESRRVNDFEIAPRGFLTESSTGYRFSQGWDVHIPGEAGSPDEDYVLTPATDGMYNVFFYELLADVQRPDGELVGRAFVELLPGARNDHMDVRLAFSRRG